MKVREILLSKGGQVFTIEEDASLDAVVKGLVENKCGSLVVCRREGEMIGIITERDILRACADHPEGLTGLLVSQYMSADVHKGRPEADISEVMGLMTEKRIRHLPILEDGKLAGMISIGDIVKAQHNQLHVENHYLKNYIQS